MATPDVRVRLSAEGVAEVVSALRKIQAESLKNAKGAGRAFSDFGASLRGVQGLLVQLGAAVSVGSFVAFIKRSSEAADEIGKMSQRVGASVENLSALSAAAQLADVPVEQLQAGMVRFGNTVAAAGSGSKDAEQAFRSLGISISEFKGLDAAERLEVVAKALGGLKDSPEKTAIAFKIFGRQAADLLPLLNDLSEQGLAALIKKFKELGLVFTEDMARAAQLVNDDLKTIQLQLLVLGAAFLQGLAPAVHQAMEGISGDVGKASRNFVEFGRIVGEALKYLYLLGSGIYDSLATQVVQVVFAITQGAKAIRQAVTGDLVGAMKTWNTTLQVIAHQYQLFLSRQGERVSRARTPTPTGALPERRPQGKEAPEDLASQFQKREQLLTASLEHERNLLKLRNRLSEEEDARYFEQGLVGIKELYRRRRDLLEKGAAAEIEILKRQRVLEQANPDEEDRLKKTQAIDAQIQEVKLRTAAESSQLKANELKETKDLTKQRIESESKVLEAQGQEHAARMIALDEERDAYELNLRQQGFSAEEAKRMATEWRTVTGAVEQFNAISTQASAEMNDLAVERSRIESQAQAGLISETEARRRLIALDEERLPKLRALAKALMDVALATANPELIAFAKAFNVEVQNTTDSLHGMQNVAKEVGDAFKDSLAGALREVGREVQTLQGFVLNFLDSVLSALQAIASQKVAEGIFDFFGGLFGKGGQVGGKKAGKKAAGGPITGPGTGTSDSIPIMASAGEYIIPAREVKRLGVFEMLEAIRRGEGPPIARALQVVREQKHLRQIGDSARQRFARGGMVMPQRFSATAAVREAPGRYRDLEDLVGGGLDVALLRAGAQPVQISDPTIAIAQAGAQRMAEGGLVEAIAEAGHGGPGGEGGRGGPGAGGTLKIELSTDPDAVLRVLDSPQGARIMQKKVAEYASGFRAAMRK